MSQAGASAPLPPLPSHSGGAHQPSTGSAQQASPGSAQQASAGSAQQTSPGSRLPAPAPGSATTTSASTTTGTGASTPALLARMRLGLVIACVLVGSLVAGLLALEVVRASRADDDTAQLIRIQEIKANLLRADALATNAFLIGGLEPAAQRQAYDAALDAAVQDITEAAAAQRADTEVLTALSQQVAVYSELMGQARANNRQGKPVGAAYLRQASADLRSTTMPLVEALITANEERSTRALTLVQGWLLGLPVMLALVLLWMANRSLARRFHRRVNVGLAAAAALLVGLGALSVQLVSLRQSANDTLRQGAYAQAVDASRALSAANNARAFESLRLVERGSGTKWEKPWDEQVAIISEIEGRGAASVPWRDYAAGHRAVVERDTKGEWDEAVALSTDPQGLARTFDALDSELRGQVAAASSEVSESLSGGVRGLLATAIMVLLLGIAAAVVAWRGVGARLKEYA